MFLASSLSRRKQRSTRLHEEGCAPGSSDTEASDIDANHTRDAGTKTCWLNSITAVQEVTGAIKREVEQSHPGVTCTIVVAQTDNR
jgi:hypothetical protein